VTWTVSGDGYRAAVDLEDASGQGVSRNVRFLTSDRRHRSLQHEKRSDGADI
jgi:hypothetical protein